MTATASLHHRLYAAESSAGVPVVILHGLFGSHRNWHTIAQALQADGNCVYAVDLRNHGASAHLPVMNYEVMSDDVETFVTDTIGQPVHLVGHSMGGKVAMAVALRGIIPLRTLSVIDIAPVSYPEHIEPNRGLIDAMLSVNPQQYATRAAIETALTPTVPDIAVRQLLLQNIVNRNNHRHWRLNLPAIRQNLPILTDFPCLRVPTAIPAQFIQAQNSDYITRHHFPAIQTNFQNVTIIPVNNTTHWCHTENPRAIHHHIKSVIAAN